MLKHPRSGKPAPRFLVLHDGIIGCTEKADNYKALATLLSFAKHSIHMVAVAVVVVTVEAGLEASRKAYQFIIGLNKILS